MLFLTLCCQILGKFIFFSLGVKVDFKFSQQLLYFWCLWYWYCSSLCCFQI